MTHVRRQASAGTVEPRRGTIRRPRPKRSTFARLVGAAGMVGLTAALFWLLTDDGFRVTEASVSFEGLRFADEAVVRDRLEVIDREPNVFRVRAADIVGTVSELPDVDAAAATVTLPARVSVRLQERRPLFVWSDGTVAWMVDEDGMLFGPTGSTPARTTSPTDETDATDERDATDETDATEETDARGQTAGAAGVRGRATAPVDPAAAVADLGLPVVQDDRLPVEPPSVGSHLPAADMAVMTRLLALTPERLGSRAGSLDLRVDQKLGYVLSSDRGWQAIFGHYSPRIQPPERIAPQVQCLQAVIAAEERRLEVVRLAMSEDGCGTYTERG